MVAAEEGHVVGVDEFVAEEEGHALDGEGSSVDVVPEEQVGRRLRGVAVQGEQCQEVFELAMEILNLSLYFPESYKKKPRRS